MALLNVIGFLLVELFVLALSQDCSFRGGESLQQPHILNSSKSQWHVTLRAEKGNLTVDWLSLERRTYNKMIPAPTIMIKQGDKLEILLENRLDKADKPGKLNEHRFPDSTNIHLHGMHIDSKVPGDNVLIRIKPGQSYLYSYEFEKDQPSGTFWYHPHFHGSTIIQVNSGMAGMLIVQDSEGNISDQLKAVTCPFNCQHDVQLVFQSTLLYKKGTPSNFVMLQNLYNDTVRGTWSTREGCPPTNDTDQWLTDSSGLNDFTTNGQFRPVLTITAGQMKRFRMVNAGGSPILEVEMVNNETGLHDCEYKEIALDGVYLDQPRVPRQYKSLLVPAGRADWLVKCNTPGTYVIRSQALPIDNNSTGELTETLNVTLLTINVVPNANDHINSEGIGEVPLPTRPHYINFETRDDLETSFRIEVGPQVTLNREHFAGPHYFRHKAKVGQLVQWRFLNTAPREGHPIHIHINHFKVVGYEPYTGPVGQTIKSNASIPHQPWMLFSQDTTLSNRACYYQHAGFEERYRNETPSNDTLISYPHYKIWDKNVPGTVGYAQRGDYRDTLMVPPLSNITIQLMLHKFTGTVVVHCHFLSHEDFGMMLLVDIFDPEEGGKVDVNPKSGNALPGQCNPPSERQEKRWYEVFSILAFTAYPL